MAEAVVDGAPMSRFFCHKCSIEIERLLPGYKCPQCASGFIEELEGGGNNSGSGMDIISEDLRDLDVAIADMEFSHRRGRDLLELLFGMSHARPQAGAPNRGNAGGGRRLLNWPRNAADTRRPGSSNRARQEETFTIEDFIQDFLLNLSGTGSGQPGSQDGQPPVLFLGNPGDYVWGRDGLDAIVTRLLNQLDGTGPPPLPRKQIDEIPTTTVTQSQVDCKLQCSVCWEDFKLSEPVRQLPCQHVYHEQCIVPWLELHGTCPICRQSLGGQSSAEANQDTVDPSLAALFRAANEFNSNRTPSTSSASSSTSLIDSD